MRFWGCCYPTYPNWESVSRVAPFDASHATEKKRLEEDHVKQIAKLTEDHCAYVVELEERIRVTEMQCEARLTTLRAMHRAELIRMTKAHQSDLAFKLASRQRQHDISRRRSELNTKKRSHSALIRFRTLAQLEESIKERRAAEAELASAARGAERLGQVESTEAGLADVAGASRPAGAARRRRGSSCR